jgi:hypothetical protein
MKGPAQPRYDPQGLVCAEWHELKRNEMVEEENFELFKDQLHRER